jgi:uncharacterized protein YjbI with pentapeptide repeats
MANQEHLEILKQGVEVWNRWREEHADIRPDLSEADLTGVHLSGAHLHQTNFYRANLSDTYIQSTNLFESDFRYALLCRADFNHSLLDRANLSYANLHEASVYLAHCDSAIFHRADLRNAQLFETKFRRADFSHADLSQASLGEANFIDANLSGSNLSDAYLTGAVLSGTNLSGANLSGAYLYRTILVNTDLTRANLSNCFIYGIAAWNVHLEDAIQKNLVITLAHEPTITVDNLEVAQFIHLLLNHKKLRDVLNSVTDRGVLILGRFGGGGLEVLHAIAAKLREENYLPIIFDFERPQDRNFTETVKTLAGLSRFIIADLSGPSVPQELYATVPHFKIPFVPIIEAGRKPFAMSVDILEYPWVVRPPVTFATREELLEQLPIKVIAPAEEKHQARQKLLDELFKET